MPTLSVTRRRRTLSIVTIGLLVATIAVTARPAQAKWPNNPNIICLPTTEGSTTYDCYDLTGSGGGGTFYSPDGGVTFYRPNPWSSPRDDPARGEAGHPGHDKYECGPQGCSVPELPWVPPGPPDCGAPPGCVELVPWLTPEMVVEACSAAALVACYTAVQAAEAASRGRVRDKVAGKSIGAMCADALAKQCREVWGP